jgi:3-dehydroquinate synthase
MGTGKSAVGREVARRLGRPFVDMDAEIEAQAGKSIPEIFAEDGEPAFRAMEAAMCQTLGRRSGLVIATGGGALIPAENRAAMMRSGTVICLVAGAQEILRRVRGGTRRPLLEVADPLAEIERLLEARRAAYAAIPWQVETTGRPVEEAVAAVVRLAGREVLPVRHPGGRYVIQLGDGLLDALGGALRAAEVPHRGRVALVSNPVVAPFYQARAVEALEGAGYAVFPCSVPDGERHKTLETVHNLYHQFLAGGLDRSGTVVALGGGVTGDMAGFAAATFMRGVRFVPVPTTLLAMVDASVGGKTGVDLPQGKNLVGAFKQPALVVVDPQVLSTLPKEEFRAGMAEVLKHGIIGAPDLWDALEPGREALTLSAAELARALQVKIEVVEEDPFEGGRRAVLNLGHTAGHALERLSDFSLRHGEAVSAGLVVATRIAVALDRAERALARRVEAALVAWGLPVRCPPFEADAIWAAMAHDKKRRGRGLRWVLPHALGHVEIVSDVPRDLVIGILRDLGAT